MSEVPEELIVGDHPWQAAQEWAFANAERVGLECYLKSQWYIIVEEPGGDARLEFYRTQADDSEESYLHGIEYKVIAQGRVYWDAIPGKPGVFSGGKPPKTLKELITTGYASGGRPTLKSAVSEIYDGIMSRLFPSLEHWELHTDPGEYTEGTEIGRLIQSDLSFLEE